MKEEFIKIFKENIKREGSDKLLDYLIKSDFFVAPASTKFHLCVEGGLCLHSIDVYKRLKQLVETEKLNVSDETVAIISLLHDICKIRYYKTEKRNVKENGEWIQKDYYYVDEDFPYGHGEKSVFIISNFMRLTPEEAVAINWHMGEFDDRVKGGSGSCSKAFNKYPLAFLLHIADLMATYIDERI